MTQNVGGQAVLEGVMMRGPRNWAVAVRKPDGEIAQVARSIDPLMARHWALRLPVVRGVVALGESLAIGFRALSVSANYAAQEEQEGDAEPAEIGRWALVFSFAVAIGFAVMLFKVSPALLADLLPIKSGGWFVIVEGLIRVTIFVAYLSVLSLIPYAAKHAETRVLIPRLARGLWLQRLTTREPTLDQLEVSIRALREVLEREGRLAPADRRVEVMA